MGGRVRRNADEQLTRDAPLRQGREGEALVLLASCSVAHAAIGMALVSTDGGWLQVNPALCRMLGYEEGELLTTTLPLGVNTSPVTAAWCSENVTKQKPRCDG